MYSKRPSSKLLTSFLLSLVFLTGAVLGIILTGSVVYAQGRLPAVLTNENSSLLWFSLVVFIFIPLLAVLILFLNRILGISSGSGQTQFETERLYFAAVVLTGLSLLFLESMAMYYWAKDPMVGKEIFDTCKTVIPPIVTLVIGYYFSKNEQRQPITSDRWVRSEEEHQAEN